MKPLGILLLEELRNPQRSQTKYLDQIFHKRYWRIK